MQPPVLKLLRCPILQFSPCRGDTINVKFGTVEETSALPNFTLLGGYLGISGPKNTKICQNISAVVNFFAPQGRIPRQILVKFMCYMRVTCLHIVLKIGAVWFINDKFVGTKLWWVISPLIFEAPRSEATGRTEKVKVGPKMVQTCAIHMPSLVAICRRTAAREEKMGVFCWFVCLFVTLTVCVSLGYRCAHCEGYIVAIYR